MKKLILLFLFLFSSIVSFSKTGGNISGIILDEKNVPFPFVNVILIQSSDSSIVKAVMSDENGKYRIDNVQSGSFKLMIAMIGYEKFYSDALSVNGDNSINVPDVALLQGSVNLQAANVTALKPFIEHRIDRTIVNVENSIVNAGATALEILQRSPGVTVDNDGNVILNGKQGVLVMIDNKPTYLSQRDLYDLLRNTSSDQLSDIEIITNPSSKYDAAGTSGIINIRMRRRQSTGFNGQVQSSYGQGVYPDVGGGLSLNYGNQKINLFSGYDYGDGWYFENIAITRRFSQDGFNSTFAQHSFNKGEYVNQNFRGGLDYSISKNQTIGILARGGINTGEEKTTSATDIFNNSSVSDSGYITQNFHTSKWNNVSATLNYQYRIDTLGKELSADVTYAHYSNGNDFIFETEYYNHLNDFRYSEISNNEQPAEIDIRSFKIDYTHPLSKDMKFEIGIKASDVESDNDVKYFNVVNSENIPDMTKTNHFNYSEMINAAYINWSAEFGKFGIQTGLRGEQTIADGIQVVNNKSFSRKYFQLFPSVFLSYKKSDNHTFGVSYSRRIDRPGYYQLNPFKYFIDPYNYMEGNPFLLPQLTNSYELSYHLMQLINISLKYSRTSDAMTELTKQIDSTRTTFIFTENVESYDNYGIDINVPIDITQWWQSSNNFNLYNNRYLGLTSSGFVDNDITSYQFNSTNTFKLPAKIVLEANFWYNSEMIWGTWIVEPQYSLGGGVSKQFFDDRLNLRINYNDVFHTEITKSKIRYENINADFKRVFDSQFFRVHLSYKFGKQSQRQRMRSNSAEEEQNRVNQGGR